MLGAELGVEATFEQLCRACVERGLSTRSTPAPLKWHATSLANTRQTHAVLGLAKPAASAFERLSFAGKLMAEIAGRRPQRLGLVVSDALPDAAEWCEALLSAAWAASFALPHFRSQPGEHWQRRRRRHACLGLR